MVKKWTVAEHEAARLAALERALRALQQEPDNEQAHIDADELLLDYIGDPGVRAAYEALNRWYG